MKKTRDKADLVLGVGWYRENQWPILLQHVPVQEDLHRTYAEWLEEANERMDELVQAGIQAVKIPVDVHEMIRWCRDQGVALDGKGRSAYVAMLTKEHLG